LQEVDGLVAVVAGSNSQYAIVGASMPALYEPEVVPSHVTKKSFLDSISAIFRKEISKNEVAIS
jgi:hypothetical protein